MSRIKATIATWLIKHHLARKARLAAAIERINSRIRALRRHVSGDAPPETSTMGDR